MNILNLINDWKEVFKKEFLKPYMKNLKYFLQNEKKSHKIIYPHSSNWFRAFILTSLRNTRVVILGQDPYHKPGQANGLSFSVSCNSPIPPSLNNIYIELENNNVNFKRVNHGCLKTWAQQGVLMLNSILTVEKFRAGSHKGKGWEIFTDKIISVINKNCKNVVFLLWGNYAREKLSIINSSSHLVLQTSHPSPLSAYNGFFGSKHFSIANDFLIYNKKKAINWLLPNKCN